MTPTSQDNSATLRKLQSDIEVLHRRAARFEKLRLAVEKVYRAGYWSCDRGEEAEWKQLWTDLRDAAGIAAGGAPVKLRGGLMPRRTIRMFGSGSPDRTVRVPLAVYRKV